MDDAGDMRGSEGARGWFRDPSTRKQFATSLLGAGGAND